jgi:hypothetical protein
MNLHRSTLLLLALSAAAAPASRTLALSDSAAAEGRALAKEFADTVVSVEVVATIRVTIGDHAQPPRENKIEVNGTFLSETGLTVTVLSEIDPRAAMESMMNARAFGGQHVEIAETEFKDVKLRLANNTEVPAVIVLKDPDLNLVFIAPLPDASGKKRTFPFVSLGKEATGEVLRDYYLVNRAPKSLQRVPIVRATTIVGIVEKPRRMYLLSEVAPGVPIFDPAGLILGVTTQYLDNGRPTGFVVLTPGDVAELAAQAAAIKPEDMVEKTAPADLPAKADASAVSAPAKAEAPAAAPPAKP